MSTGAQDVTQPAGMDRRPNWEVIFARALRKLLLRAEFAPFGFCVFIVLCGWPLLSIANERYHLLTYLLVVWGLVVGLGALIAAAQWKAAFGADAEDEDTKEL